jgi:hypothetical protein
MSGKKINVVRLAVVLSLTGAFALGVLAGTGLPEQRKSVPSLIPYQGVLEKNGQPVNAIGEEKVDFRVALFDAVQAGNKVWPVGVGVYEEHSVNVFNGRFSFQIGSQVDYQHVAATPLFLDVQVSMDSEPWVQLAQRQQFLSAPYAIAAHRSDTDFLVAQDLNVSGHLRVTGSPDDFGADLAGPDQDAGSLSAVRITSGQDHEMLLDGDDISTAGELGINRSSGNPVAAGGDLQVAGMLKIKVDDTVYPSGSNATADSFQLIPASAPVCERGAMFVGIASAQSDQDSLCVCMRTGGVLEWWCFNP